MNTHDDIDDLRSLAEIEKDMDFHSVRGHIGQVMDLVDEHGHVTDCMFYAIYDCDLKKISAIEKLGVNVTEKNYLRAAIRHNQLEVVIHQVHAGADIEEVLRIADEFERTTIWKWARCWKYVNPCEAKKDGE